MKTLLFICMSVFTAVTWIGTITDAERVEPCGNGTFTSSYQVCCGDEVFDNPSGFLKCCGEDVFDSSNDSHICCDDKKLYTGNLINFECCADGLYDSRYWKCCPDKYSRNYSLINISDGHLRCCCSTSFVPTDDIYCNEEHCLVQKKGFGICNGTEYYKQNDSCCNEKLIEGIPTDYDTYKCCGQKILRKEEDGTCCGSVFAYSGLGCCGTDKVFNMTSQRCCMDNVLNISADQDDCCGSDLYNTETQGCCGQETYDRSQEQCCGGIKAAPKSLNCCGKESFDKNTHLCCKRGVRYVAVQKREPTHNACCPKNKEFKSCHKKAENICGYEPYDNETDLCCRYTVLKCARQRGYKCCAYSLEALVKNASSNVDSCVLYNSSEKCDRNEKTSSFPAKNTGLLDYNICRACTGEWSPADSLRALTDGRVDACKTTAMKMRVIKKTKKKKRQQKTGDHIIIKYRMTLLHLMVEENVYNPPDRSLHGIKLRAYIPCRCSHWTKDDSVVLVTSTKIGQQIRLGDSDVLLPYTTDIDNQLKWKKLLCP